MLLEKLEDTFIKVEFILSDDKYKIFLQMNSKPDFFRECESNLLDYNFLKEILFKYCQNKELIFFDVIKDVLKNIRIAGGNFYRRIAKGFQPLGGIPSRIVYLVKKFDKSLCADPNEDFIDIRYTSLFDNVKKGDKVARIYLPKRGEPGQNALGEEILGDLGEDFKLKISGDFKQEKDEKNNYITLISRRDGFIKEESGTVMVKDTLQINGDLDYEYGKIDFIGNVYIKGNVYKDFMLSAGKNIVVDGDTHQAKLETHYGDVYVKGFIIGGEKSKISSGGAIFAKGCRDATLEANGSVFLDKESYNSKISSLDSVSIKRGSLIGGECLVVNSLIANDIGNKSELRTLIQACSKKEVILLHRELKEKLDLINHVKESLKNYLGNILVNPEKLNTIDEKYKSKMKMMFKRYQDMENSRRKILKEIDKVVGEEKINEKFFCKINEKIFPGTIIVVGEAKKIFLKEEDGPVKISIDNKNFSNFLLEKINDR